MGSDDVLGEFPAEKGQTDLGKRIRAAPGIRIRSEGRRSDADLRRMTKVVDSVASAWGKRLNLDPAYDAEDMAQELYLRYWQHIGEAGEHPGVLTVRRWAWDVMRQWGYKGRSGGLLRCDRLTREVSMCGHPATLEYDITDEEILDSIACERATGMPYRHEHEDE